MKKYLIIISLLLSITMVYGQAPQLINYQGKLDSSGVPISGTRNLTFAISSDTASLTVALWTETQNNVTITNGIFNVLLGSVTPFPGTLFTNPGERFIGVKVGTATEMKPRLKITSVAYSLRANQADDVADNVVTSTKILDGAVTAADLATNSVTTVKITDNNITSAKIAAGAVGTTQIADNAVTSAKILDGTVAAADLASNSVTTAKIADNNVTAAKIADEPGVSNTYGTSSVNIPLSQVIAVDSVDITIPASGYVVVTTGGYLLITHINGTETRIAASISRIRGDISTVSYTAGSVPSVIATSVWRYPCTTSKMYSETGGTIRYYLNATSSGGTSAQTNIVYSYIRAVYYPTLYGTLSKDSEVHQGVGTYQYLDPSGDINK
ncbi:MAG: hypothetical protein Q8K98_06925 [Bacteroidota bacterium]|nr:hypothetical protein [Bacteroidota bacterium]